MWWTYRLLWSICLLAMVGLCAIHLHHKDAHHLQTIISTINKPMSAHLSQSSCCCFSSKLSQLSCKPAYKTSPLPLPVSSVALAPTLAMGSFKLWECSSASDADGYAMDVLSPAVHSRGYENTIYEGQPDYWALYTCTSPTISTPSIYPQSQVYLILYLGPSQQHILSLCKYLKPNINHILSDYYYMMLIDCRIEYHWTKSIIIKCNNIHSCILNHHPFS